MIRLDPMSSLRLQLDSTLSGGAAAIVSFYDTNSYGQPSAGATKLSTLNSAQSAEICAAPATGFIRNIDTLSIVYSGTETHLLNLKITSATVDYTLKRQSISAGVGIFYGDSPGWQTI